MQRLSPRDKQNRQTQESVHDDKASVRKRANVSQRGKNILRNLSYLAQFLLVFLGILGLLYRLDSHFRVHDVEVLGASKEHPFRGDTYFKEKPIWQLEEEEMLQYLRNANPLYKVESIEKQYPSKVKVTVKRLLPAAYVAVGEGYFLLSHDGVLIEKQREEEASTYPIITFYQDIPYNGYQKGDAIGIKEITDALYFLDAVHAAKKKVISIDIEGFHMLGLYTEEGVFYFSSEKDPGLQKYQFEQAMMQFDVEGTQISTLDLRFEKPIVTF